MRQEEEEVGKHAQVKDQHKRDREIELRMTKAQFAERFDELSRRAKRQEIVVVLTDASNRKYVFHNAYKRYQQGAE